MTADTPARVSDAELAEFNSKPCDPLQIEDRIGLDLRDSRALTQAKAERIAALEADVAAWKERAQVWEEAAMRYNNALGGAHKDRKAAESSLAETRAKVEGLEKALTFYRDGFRLHTKRGPTGIDHSEWKPTKGLLEDCGETALAALSALPEAKP